MQRRGRDTTTDSDIFIWLRHEEIVVVLMMVVENEEEEEEKEMEDSHRDAS